MLKTKQDNKLWMVSQPDHSQLAGFFAAHWGNSLFAQPGSFATPVPVADPARLRDETVLAIAEHDNGWWEWEAIPDLSADDGFPANLGEVLTNQQAGMERWRIGLKRFARNPMVNLLISSHAYALYAARAWTDRVTITVTPLGGRRVKFDPYPFDIDPLPVMLPARIVELPAEKPANFQTWWHARVPQRVEFTMVSGK